MYKLAVLMIACLSISLSQRTWCQEMSYSSLPTHLQLYPRDEQDSAVLHVAGKVVSENHNQIKLEVYKNQDLWKNYQSPLQYEADGCAVI